MDRAKLNYHKENIEKAQTEVEEMLAHQNSERWILKLYATLKALVCAVGFILDEMEKGTKKHDQ